MTQEVLKMVLEALYSIAHNTTDDPRGQAYKAITVIKEALAQPEQEPVKYSDYEPDGVHHNKFDTTPPQRTEPVIDQSAAKRIATVLGWTPPRTWVGLTDETLDDVYFCVEGGATPLETWREQARTIEAKLKQKNGYAEEKNT
jgi:hypothetical protein